jgi:hypothetical protein
MKKIIAVIVFSVLVALLPIKTVHAASSDSLGRILTDSLYGGAAGALVGAAAEVLSSKPHDYGESIGKGAAIGVILGAIYGTMKVSGALAEIKDGEIKMAFPEIKISPDASAWNLDMVKIHF